jgi:uncharacterized protein
MKVEMLAHDAVLRIGEVCEVDGRKVGIKVDREKNLTDIFLNGSIIRNISVNSFIEIRKGFLTLIGKVDGERIEEPLTSFKSKEYEHVNKNERYLTVSLCGYIGLEEKFEGGAKELPLIGNEAYIVTKGRLLQVHNLCSSDALSVSIGNVDNGDIPISLPIDGLFNSHIAIFGNTGSGKSNTLASLYRELCKELRKKSARSFVENTRFLLLDFNGEYSRADCITAEKKVYKLSTRNDDGDKIPLYEESFLDIEMLSILSNATDKTQKPFLKRTIDFYQDVFNPNISDPDDYFKNIVRKRITAALQMSDKEKADLILDHLRQILPKTVDNSPLEVKEGLEWHNTLSGFKLKDEINVFLASSPDRIPDTVVYKAVDHIVLGNDFISRFVSFLYLQLIGDILSDRAQNEHIAPAINKLRSKQKDIDKVFSRQGNQDLWSSNFVVIDLSDVNLDMKKTIPLLLSKKVYTDHKLFNNEKSLTIIIDEAHNILSTESFREAESWKDYRLETFEEIIKEGRKFGVFVTISSQRPNDISPTIISQAHNYFIHRLVNQKDLQTIANAVSYIDRITGESIPTLPTGTCIFSGVASQMPLKIDVTELPDLNKPKSETLKYETLLIDGASFS